MEHIGMARMFKSLVDTGLEGFLATSGSVYERVVVEFFINAKVVAVTVISTVANRKLALKKYSWMFRIRQWLRCRVGFLGLKFRSGHQVNWEQVLFQVLVAMVNNPTCQSQGFAVQLSVVLQRLVKADLGETVKLHPQKVLTNKSVQTYINKNMTVGPAGETSKVSGATASEHKSTADSIPYNRAGREAGEKNKAEKSCGEEEKEREGEEGGCTNQTEVATQSGQQRISLSRPQSDLETATKLNERAFYDKLETLAANMNSTQTLFETSLVRQFTEHQLQIASDLDFVKLQLAEMVTHLKEMGDAKKGEGPSRPSSTRGEGPSSRKDQGTRSNKKRKWFRPRRV
ncbi:hypothetical protein F511_16765 [Dorcoceras hygrometricum]|uniref:Uncharacterized protein n=1 Tax=Dorcoceras hygrometricum TaxID=472368 RepID=A0A2Z7BNT4_9LAMI|nr:hypothetical protein F511_16765 [Dorcoceras hygrometricum]